MSAMHDAARAKLLGMFGGPGWPEDADVDDAIGRMAEYAVSVFRDIKAPDNVDDLDPADRWMYAEAATMPDRMVGKLARGWIGEWADELGLAGVRRLAFLAVMGEGILRGRRAIRRATRAWEDVPMSVRLAGWDDAADEVETLLAA